MNIRKEAKEWVEIEKPEKDMTWALRIGNPLGDASYLFFDTNGEACAAQAVIVNALDEFASDLLCEENDRVVVALGKFTEGIKRA